MKQRKVGSPYVHITHSVPHALDVAPHPFLDSGSEIGKFRITAAVTEPVAVALYGLRRQRHRRQAVALPPSQTHRSGSWWRCLFCFYSTSGSFWTFLWENISGNCCHGAGVNLSRARNTVNRILANEVGGGCSGPERLTVDRWVPAGDKAVASVYYSLIFWL